MSVLCFFLENACKVRFEPASKAKHTSRMRLLEFLSSLIWLGVLKRVNLVERALCLWLRSLLIFSFATCENLSLLLGFCSQRNFYVCSPKSISASCRGSRLNSRDAGFLPWRSTV